VDASRVAHACAAVAGRHATELTIEHRLVRTDGTVRWARTSLTRIESIVVGFRLVAKVEDITEGRQALDELRYLADHDLLTGLPNRRRALGRLDSLLNSGHDLDADLDRAGVLDFGRELVLDGTDPVEADTGGKLVAVLFCDLDGFKAVNDRLGHSAGDQLLVRVAQRLAGVVRPGDLLCRHGGDEFVVVCGALGHADVAVAIAQRCIEALNEPFALDGGAVDVSLCVGVAVALRTASSPSELVAAADAALYQAKANGRSCWYLTSVASS
jgi:diguanylate cyclase (GGDEF)-like protein